MPENAVREKIKVTVESGDTLKMTFEVVDPVTRAGMEFLAARNGQRIEQHCLAAILHSFGADEECAHESYFHEVAREVSAV
jgi:hypothetical protein